MKSDSIQSRVAQAAYKSLVLRTGHTGSENEGDMSDITEWEIDLERDPISSGGFGDVFAGMWLGHTKVAVKRLRMSEAKQKSVLKNFIKEVRVWKR